MQDDFNTVGRDRPEAGPGKPPASIRGRHFLAYGILPELEASSCHKGIIGGLDMNVCRYGLSLLGLGLLLAALPFILPAAAQSVPVLVPVDGKDPVDGSQLTGVRLADETRRAFLFFLCDADNTNPRIIFGHGSDLHAPTKPLGFDVEIEGMEPQRHYFAILPNKRSGVFFVRTAAMYEPRFGTSPPVFDETSRAVNKEYILWTDNIYNQVTADFFFGKVASLFFTDGFGESHGYTFQLALLAENIGRLADCYEAPRLY